MCVSSRRVSPTRKALVFVGVLEGSVSGFFHDLPGDPLPPVVVTFFVCQIQEAQSVLNRLDLLLPQDPLAPSLAGVSWTLLSVSVRSPWMGQWIQTGLVML